MADTNIEWATKVWNPVRGCSIVSLGCRSCYAMKQAHRFAGPGGKYEGLTRMSNGGPVWTGWVRTVPEMLDAPLRWVKPQRVFVNSMSDLFHDDVPDQFVDQVFAVMARCRERGHVFQILTKRPERMRTYLGGAERKMDVLLAGATLPLCAALDIPWPLPNVWLGVSVEDQATADERIPLLLETPAALRWVSYEPALGAVDFSTGFADRSDWCDISGHDIGDRDGTCVQCSYDPDRPYLDWVVVGGESGPGARPFDIAWACDTVEQCKAAGVACFVKQIGARPTYVDDDARLDDEGWPEHVKWGRNGCLTLRDRKGGDPSEWPADLRVRQFPEVKT